MLVFRDISLNMRTYTHFMKKQNYIKIYTQMYEH